MTTSSKYPTFSIVRQIGTPRQGHLPDGSVVYAQDKFFIPEKGRFIPCIEYDDHFLYEIPDRLAKKYPGPIYRCSCGSAAVILGQSGYVWGMSPSGLMFACQEHITYGKHATGGSRWI